MLKAFCCVGGILVLVAAGAPAVGQVSTTPTQPVAVTLGAGVDGWHTPGGGLSFAGFANDPIPPGFFCQGSPEFAGQIPLRGSQLITSPPNALGNIDTLIQRDAAAIPSNGCGSVNVWVVAMNLEDDQDLVISCDTGPTIFDVKMIAAPSQPLSVFTVCRSSSCGGTFTGTLDISVWVFFINRSTGQVLGPIHRTVSLIVSPVPWAHNPFPGGFTSGSFWVDIDCDGLIDIQVPGTSNFFPGTECVDDGMGGKKEVKKTQVCCHNGGNQPYAHCVFPACGDPEVEILDQ